MPSLAITLRSAAMYAVLSVLTLVGCDVPASGLLPTSIDGEAGEPTGAVGTTGSSAGSSPTGIALPHRPPLRIASFNIQTFGLSKLQRTQVVDILCDIVRQFDVVAIQEIRSENQNMIPEFVERVNDGGADYDYVIGPRLGRTATYQEQYAYIFDANSVRLDWNSVFTMVDEEDRLHREPLIATFRGYHAAPTSAGVSAATTGTVVVASVAILLCDYVLTAFWISLFGATA